MLNNGWLRWWDTLEVAPFHVTSLRCVSRYFDGVPAYAFDQFRVVLVHIILSHLAQLMEGMLGG
jgi:hypothetical protein